MRQQSLANLRRKKNFRQKRKNFLIVCEGEKTEPLYFEAFRVPKKIFDVKGEGANTASLVGKTMEIRDKSTTLYDEVWCVLDRDSFPAENFNKALKLADNNKIKVAFSNEAFEIWYLLHFHYHDSATSRTEYGRMLTERLGIKYRKNDPAMYDRLLSMQGQAIRNAEKLLLSYPEHAPEKNNPSTTVHLLVMELNKFSV